MNKQLGKSRFEIMMKATKILRAALTVIAVAMLALFAFVLPQQAMAGTVTIPAPDETASIHLGIKDPPASAKLDGWYCTDTDLSKTIRDLIHRISEEAFNEMKRANKAVDRGDVEHENMSDVNQTAVDWQFKFLSNGWPFKLAGMQKSPTENKLDAPPGGSKVYTFKYCYTKAELQTVRDKVSRWLHWTLSKNQKPDNALNTEIAKWTHTYNE